MSSSQLPTAAIPKPLPDDDDDVSWALQTAAVQWGRGAYHDAILWLRRAADSASEKSAWSRVADLNATASMLEKLLARLPSRPMGPSLSRAAGFDSAFGPSPGGHPWSQGLSSAPPPVSMPAPSVPVPLYSDPANVTIEVQEDELELSEDELRYLETEASSHGGVGTIDSARPSWGTLQSEKNSGGLPAFALESSGPPPAQVRPTFSPEPSAAIPVASRDASATSVGPGRVGSQPAGSTSAAPSTLPSFPLEANISSLPPGSQWPRLSGQGIAQLPPNSALPVFESVPPSRPFVDNGDDGTPGIDERGLGELELYDHVEPEGRRSTQVAAATLGSPRQGSVPSDDRASARSRPSSAPLPPVGQGSVPSDDRASARSRPSTLALPPASHQDRSKSAKPLLNRAERRFASTDVSTDVPESSFPPAPAAGESRVPDQPRSRGPAIEPRMPKRTLSYAAPLDFTKESDAHTQLPVENRASLQSSVAPSTNSSSSRSPSTNAPTLRRLESARPASVPPPSSARSLEPEDLPTVTSPSLSHPRVDVRSCGSGDRRTDAADTHSAETKDERRRLSFRSEEPKTLAWRSEDRKSAPDQLDVGVDSRRTSRVSAHPEVSADLAPVPDAGRGEAVEESLAILPPVVSRDSAASNESTSGAVVLSGVRLTEVRGFADLPVSAHRLLAKTAHIDTLAAGEEVSFFAVALVLDGWVALMPAIADTACATAVVGEVVFTEGTLSDCLMLRVVAGQDDVAVATWDSKAVANATRDCPWVADDFRLLADGFQALAGACLGPLGDRLDDSLRSIVTSRCEIRTLLPGEQLCAAGKIVPGMHIVGGGEIELVDENGRVTKTHATGEFLFAQQVLAGGVAPFAARAGRKGSLVLFAPRMAAHELLVSVPPLLEILAE